MGTSTSVFLIGLFGYFGFYEKWALGILFALNGFFQSIVKYFLFNHKLFFEVGMAKLHKHFKSDLQ